MIIPYLGIWQTVIVKPIAWLLLTLYELTMNYGLAIILFSLLTKILLLYFSAKSKKGMMAMQRFSPKMKELEAKYKNDKEKYNQELQKLYQTEKVNPLSGCIWTLIPWPIFIALYSAIRLPIQNMMGLAAEQVQAIVDLPVITDSLTKIGIDVATAVSRNQIAVANVLSENFQAVKDALPELADMLVNVNFNFLGLNLSLTPSFSVINAYWFLPILSGVFMWLATFIMQKMQGPQVNDAATQNAKMMNYIGPAMSIWIGFMWPTAMCLYWIANSVFGIIQDYFLTVYYRKFFDRKDAERAAHAEEERLAIQKKKELQAERRAANDKLNRSKTSKQYQQLKEQNETQEEDDLSDLDDNSEQEEADQNT